MVTFEQTIEKLESFMHRRGIDYSLENFSSFLDTINNPHHSLPPVIHIAGTNGKGSTTALLSAGLQALGYSVGTYTSPHLKCYTERIKINDIPISKPEFAKLFSSLLAGSDTLATEFELLTAGAFTWFSIQKPDYVIIETGLGGRLDATNVVTPICSVITKIGIDHNAILGHTLGEIATEKAGIIKPHLPSVTLSSQHPDALTVIQKTAKEKKADLSVVKPLSEIPEHVPLKGAFQLENIALALSTLRVLFPKSNISTQVFKLATHPGRFQCVTQNGSTVIYDGAHNPDAIEALLHAIHTTYPDQDPVFVMGSLATKDCEAMLSAVFKKATTVYWVDFWPGMSLSIEDVIQKTAWGKQLKPAPDLDTLQYQHPLLVVTGSMHFIGRFT